MFDFDYPGWRNEFLDSLKNDTPRIFYILHYLSLIKEDVSKRINLEADLGSLADFDPTLYADKEMQKILEFFIKEDEGNYFFFYMNRLEHFDNDRFKELKCRGTLEYAALYFDNVSLYQKMCTRWVDLKDAIGSLRVGVLDKSITCLFEDDEYLDLLEDKIGFFGPFYESIKRLPYNERRKYIKKFTNILRQRKDLVAKNDSNAFTKQRLDIFDEETYLTVSLEQFKNIIAKENYILDDDFYYRLEYSYSGIKEDDFWGAKVENAERINKLVKEGFKHSIFHVNNEEVILDLFTDSELLQMTDKEWDYFLAAKDEYTVEAAIRMYKMNKNVANYNVTCLEKFLDLFSEEEVVLLGDRTLKLFQKKKEKYFQNDRDSKQFKFVKTLVQKEINIRKKLEKK